MENNKAGIAGMMVMCNCTLQATGLNGARPCAELHAGGNWTDGSNCGSQCQNANNYRWNTNTNIGTQFLADPRDLSEPNSSGEKLAKLTPWLEPDSLSLSFVRMTKKNTKQEEGMV